jgi:arsenate reductase-like glutaredoxin family protein
MKEKDMISLATSPRQIVLFYNSKEKKHRECRAYAESAEEDLLVIDISETKVTGTQWAEVADVLDIKVEDLIDFEHPDFTAAYEGDARPDADGVIKMIQNNPNTLIHPIAIKGKKGVMAKFYDDILKLHGGDSGKVRIP